MLLSCHYLQIMFIGECKCACFDTNVMLAALVVKIKMHPFRCSVFILFAIPNNTYHQPTYDAVTPKMHGWLGTFIAPPPTAQCPITSFGVEKR